MDTLRFDLKIFVNKIKNFIQENIPKMGYSRKNPNRGGLRIYFSEPLPSWKFQICDFTLRNSRENKLLPLEIQQNCVTPLGNSKVKNQDPCNFHMSFYLSTPGNSTSFLIDPSNFHIFFLQYSRKFHVLNLPLFFFSGIAH